MATIECTDWPVVYACDVAAVDPEVLAAAKAAAVEILWGLSGRRFGVCTYAEGYYPGCAAECGLPYKSADGLWHNRIGDAADCCSLLLAHRPVRAITSVTALGVLLDAAEYRTDGLYLGRVGSCWPCGQECEAPPVEVVYEAGADLPASTPLAVGEVACEIVAGMTGGQCRLPSRMVSITRQGVTVQFATADEFTKAGRLGLPIADLWLTSVNPKGLDRQSAVLSPDLARRG